MVRLHVKDKIDRIAWVRDNKLVHIIVPFIKDLYKIYVGNKTGRTSLYYQVQKYVQQTVRIALRLPIAHQLEQVLNHLKTIIYQIYFFNSRLNTAHLLKCVYRELVDLLVVKLLRNIQMVRLDPAVHFAGQVKSQIFIALFLRVDVFVHLYRYILFQLKKQKLIVIDRPILM